MSDDTEETTGRRAPASDRKRSKQKAADTGGETTAGLSDSARLAVEAAGRYSQELAEASSSASVAFCEEISAANVGRRGLAASIAVGLAEGNARFRRRWSEATRRLVDDLCADADTEDRAADRG